MATPLMLAHLGQVPVSKGFQDPKRGCLTECEAILALGLRAVNTVKLFEHDPVTLDE